ncbi:MAG: galactose-1-phosphate uridylyltransferase [Acidobacteria bacterium]|nr:galactose-1-phosphate uridylyltransferase [Acidobacteriota bacterium]
MAELRLDPVRRRWIITGKRVPMPDALDSGAACPFCPGNERFTPKAIRERLDSAGTWRVRVFHDRAPLFRVEGSLGSEGEGMFDRMNALGAHEIVVETNQHGKLLGELTPDEIADVLEIYRDRMLDLKGDHRFRYVSVFKHQGRGKSPYEEHSHSQILATPVVPALVERELRWSLIHYRRKQRCLYCDILHQELQSGKRVVDESADCVCLCPYAARFPYEVWLIPSEHESSFERAMATSSRLISLAGFLKENLLRIQKISPQLHFSLHTEPNMASSGPGPDRWQTIPDDYHWHFEIYPELENEPGVIDGEGFYFNPISGEDAAPVLRKIEPES